MKVISIWNPFALLIVRGLKVFETRTWAPPKSLIGQRIGIASTKTIQPAQRQHFDSEDFQAFYAKLDLPETLKELPNGAILGTAILDSVELMEPEFMADVSDEEKAYGWWDEGNYAWRMTDPEAFETPIQARGFQGIWNWTPPGETPAEIVPLPPKAVSRKSRAAHLWRDLRDARWA